MVQIENELEQDEWGNSNTDECLLWGSVLDAIQDLDWNENKIQKILRQEGKTKWEEAKSLKEYTE